jgi:hypothetical protein
MDTKCQNQDPLQNQDLDPFWEVPHTAKNTPIHKAHTFSLLPTRDKPCPIPRRASVGRLGEFSVNASMCHGPPIVPGRCGAAWSDPPHNAGFLRVRWLSAGKRELSCRAPSVVVGGGSDSLCGKSANTCLRHWGRVRVLVLEWVLVLTFGTHSGPGSDIYPLHIAFDTRHFVSHSCGCVFTRRSPCILANLSSSMHWSSGVTMYPLVLHALSLPPHRRQSNVTTKKG